MRSLVLILMLVLSPLLVLSACPYDDGTLKRWGTASSWETNAVPVANARVVIGAGMNIMLDVSPPALYSLEIVNGGRLIWGNIANLELISNYVLIKDGGELWIGSEDCKFVQNATISLTGSQTTPAINIANFGNKFLGVGERGTLELHGAAYTPTWTKLSKTLKPIVWRSSIARRGMNVATFSPVTAEFIEFNTFDTFVNTTFSNDLANFINGLAKDTIVAVFTSDEASANLNSAGVAALQSIGSSIIQNIKYRSSWACIGIKGAANGTAVEDMKPEALRPSSVVSRLVSSSNGNSVLISAQGQNWTGFVSAEDRTQAILDLSDVVSSWKPGQKIVVASTDLDYMHAEENEIIACPTCTSKQIKVKTPFKYTHWGEFVYGVDERAEVGLLTRNIVIRGLLSDANDNWGAHTKVIANFTNAHFENVEYYHVGQPILAMYPVHFHMVGDVDALGGYSKPAYVKGCSVHKSFSRCFTLHGVNGLLVQNNVAHDHIGHCYFIEDGGEMRNQLIGNLGLTTHYGKLILSEIHPDQCKLMPGVDPSGCHGPATFWLTNPNNTMIGNSAAGSAFMGVWYIFPSRPTGPSALVHPNMQIQYIPMAPFDNTMVHSSPIGVMVDDGVVVDEKSVNYLGVIGARYRPHETPNMNSPRVPAVIRGLTIHHASNRGIWVRGGDYRLQEGYFADNNIGVTLASEGAMPNDPGSAQELKDAIFVGRSANGYDPYFPMRGFEVYDGPIRCINCSFFEYVPTTRANHSAIGWLMGNNWQLAPNSYLKGAKFDSKSLRVGGGGYAPYWRDINDGERNQIVKDLDGSVTGVVGASIVNGYPVHTTNRCTYREDWNMSICPHKYGQLFITNNEPATTDNGIYLVRDETSHYKLWMEGIPSGEPRNRFQPMVIINKTYTVHWVTNPPSKIDIQMTNFDPQDWVRVGVCFPPTAANFTVNYIVNNRIVTTLQPVASINDLYYTPNSNITSYYWDKEVGLLFVVLKAQYPRDGDYYCGNRGCEVVRIVATGPNVGSTSTAPGYCASAYPKYAAVEPTAPPTPSSTSASSSASTADTTGDTTGDKVDASASMVSLSVVAVLALFIVLA